MKAFISIILSIPAARYQEVTSRSVRGQRSALEYNCDGLSLMVHLTYRYQTSSDEVYLLGSLE